MSDLEKDVLVIPLHNSTIAYVVGTKSSNDWTNYGEAAHYPSWIEYRKAGKSIAHANAVMDLIGLCPQLELRQSILSHASEWASLISRSSNLGREIQVSHAGELTFLGIRYDEFAPWVTGDFLYFVVIEPLQGHLTGGDSAIGVYRLSIDGFVLERRHAAFTEDLVSDETLWNYTRDELVTLFSNKGKGQA